MDVTLPNGTVIQGVPDGTSKEQVMEFAISKGLATAEDFNIATAATDTREDEPIPEGSIISAFYEPAKAMAAGMINFGQQAAASGKQLVTGQGVDAAAEAVRQAEADFPDWGVPKTQAGQKGLENLGDLMEMGLDATRFSISGLAGLSALLTGQDGETANKIIKDINEKGIGPTAGDMTLETTGSPFLAFAASLFPEIIASVVPVTRVTKARNIAAQTAIVNRLKDADAYPVIGQGLEHIGKYVETNGIDANAVDALNQIKGIAPERIQWQIDSVIDSADIGLPPEQTVGIMKRIAQEASRSQPDKGLVKYIADGAKGFNKDDIALRAVEQGFDEGVVSMVKSVNATDRAKFIQMTEIMEKAKKDPLFAIRNRPSDIAGDSLAERVTFVKGVNENAGKQLDGIAEGLKGQAVDTSQPVNNFISRLEKMGIQLDDDFNPNFWLSDIQGVKPAESIIVDIIERMKTGGEPDAYALHQLKRFIDEKVTYGKTAEGLAGQTTTVLKQLRHEIDGVLDSNFPEYNKVNTTYAETVSALDNLQKAVGGTIDMFGENSDKAIGTTLRRLMGNTQGRVNMLDSIDELSSVARRHGADFKDDITAQVVFANELDAVFGTTAKTSFQGSLAEGTKRGLEMVTGEKAGVGMLKGVASGTAKIIKRLRGRDITDENGFKSMHTLLGRE